MYSVFIDNILLPVTPEKITWTYKGQNDTVNLINMEEINRIKVPGLMEFSFNAELPGGMRPYARYETSFKEPFVYIYELEEILNKHKSVMFCIKREGLPYKRAWFTTKKQVTIESLTVNEAANEGLDIILSIRLKEYKIKKSTKVSAFGEIDNMVRESDKVIPKVYIVKKGDNLWNICRKELNDGAKYDEIAKLNGIANPSTIFPGQVIKFE